jgi:mono/diheme cytochrome c family protein
MKADSHGSIGFGRGVLISGALALITGLAALPGFPHPEASAAAPDSGVVVVTPVRGPSWLHHLSLQVADTRMGEMGGSGPAPETSRREPAVGSAVPGGFRGAMHRFLNYFNSDRAKADEAFNSTFELTGADLYRLNCRSCHGPEGRGAPPEISSLLDPVRGTTVAGIQQQMAAEGRTISGDLAKQLAARAEKGIRDLLRDGGGNMPPFRHLRGDEVDALLGYLDHLAGVPGGNRSGMLVPQSAARIGEHVVKGTCHICHDATGPGGRGMGMTSGTIPSLESFPRDYSLNGVIHQVESGSTRMMGMMGGGMMGGGGGAGSEAGRAMPALPYFTQEEIAAAYFYLSEFPPEP